MNNDAKDRIKSGEYEKELMIAKGLDYLCNPPGDRTIERLNAIKDQLLGLFLRLERGDLSSSDTRTKSFILQDELSKVIWTLDDWRIQLENRN